MKSNYAKSLIISMGIAMLFTGLYSEARSFANGQACYMVGGSYSYDGGQGSPHDFSIPDVSVSQNYNKSNLRFVPFTTTGNDIVSGNISLFNNGDYWSCDNYTYHDYTNRHFYTSYNYIKVWRSSTTIDSSWDFYVRNDNLKSYRHISLPGGGYVENGVSFDMWFPYHGSVFLYDSLSGNTIQLIGDKTLNNKVLYVDPLESDQNVWVLDYYSKKAWSYHEDSNANLSTYMLGSWSYNTDRFFDDLKDKFTNSYTIKEGGNFAFPGTAIQKTQGGNYSFSTETKEYGKTFTFVSDLNYIPPTWSTPDDSSNTGSSALLEDYKKCINEYQPLQDIVNYSVQCNKITTNGGLSGDYYYDQYLDYVINLDYYKENNLTYTGVIKSATCKSFMNSAENYYDALNNSGSYHDHIFEIESYLGLGGTIDIEKKCGVYPGTDIYSDFEISRYCKWFGIGCGYTGNNILGFVYNNTKRFNSFFDESFGELKTSYQNGMDYFGDDLMCSNYYGKSYEWGNFLLIFVSAWLVFSLIIIL